MALAKWINDCVDNLDCHYDNGINYNHKCYKSSRHTCQAYRGYFTFKRQVYDYMAMKNIKTISWV